jgi:hypothetical protein
MPRRLGSSGWISRVTSWTFVGSRSLQMRLPCARRVLWPQLDLPGVFPVVGRHQVVRTGYGSGDHGAAIPSSSSRAGRRARIDQVPGIHHRDRSFAVEPAGPRRAVLADATHEGFVLRPISVQEQVRPTGHDRRRTAGSGRGRPRRQAADRDQALLPQDLATGIVSVADALRAADRTLPAFTVCLDRAIGG